MPPSLSALQSDVAAVIDGLACRLLNEGSLERALQRIGESIVRHSGLDPSDLIVDVRLLEPMTDEAGDGG